MSVTPNPLRVVPFATKRTVVIPRSPPPVVPKQFPLKVRLIKETVLFRCSHDWSVAQFLHDALPKLQDFFSPMITVENLIVSTIQELRLLPSDVLSKIPYFVQCRNDKTVPIITIVESPTPVRSSSNDFVMKFVLPGGQISLVKCHGDSLLGQVKEQAIRSDHKLTLHPTDDYTVKIPNDSAPCDDALPLNSIPFIDTCRRNGMTPQLMLVKKSQSAMSKREKLINVEIGSLIGSPLSWTSEDKEIAQFRKSMKWVRFSEKQKSQGNFEVPTSPLPTPNLPGKFLIKLRLPSIESSTVAKTVAISHDETASAFLERMFRKYYQVKFPNKTSQDYVMKISGLAEFIDGHALITSFGSLADCLRQGRDVDLSMVEREAYDADLYEENFSGDEEDSKYVYDHEEFSEFFPWERKHISVWELHKNFRIRIIGAENLRSDLDRSAQIYMTAGLYHGGILVAPPVTTSLLAFSENPRWCEWLTFNIAMSNIPRGTRICFTIFSRPNFQKQDQPNLDLPMGWMASQLFDYKHELKSGLLAMNTWPGEANPIGTCVGNTNPSGSTLYVEFDTFALPVIFPTENLEENSRRNLVENREAGKVGMSEKASKIMGIQAENRKRIQWMIEKDPLFELDASDKRILWEEREYCKTKAKALPKFLASVSYNDRSAVAEMHRLLEQWSPINVVDALELLDSRFGDNRVRTHAVRVLENLSDDELHDYLLQLIQVLKYEPYHDSALLRFLLRRGISSRKIGHSLFWYLKSEIHVPEISTRFGLLLEAYLRGCGTHRAELQKQIVVLKELTRCASHVKNFAPGDRRDQLLSELKKFQFPAKFQLPLNPSIEVGGVVYEKCRTMDSKKIPLWLVLQNADLNLPPKCVMFKSGDDLRQDMLTLQMIRLMDKFWKAEGLDLELSSYGCIATGHFQGMIEVVGNSETCANITKNAGGAKAAFRADPLANWLRSNNPRDEQYNAAVNKFIMSCAGYCVATFVLGIGDRHNDNFMMTRDGKLFHIDFGHFLGNYKMKFGIKRERAPFVFTPDFAFVMGGKDSENFLKFIEICCRAYNIVRRHADLFINLFAMMLSTGIPELQKLDDLMYLRTAFSLGLSEEEASKEFTRLIYEALATKTTQWNNAIHIFAHSLKGMWSSR